MIDYEVNIFDRVHRQASSKFAKGKLVSRYVASPTAFPAGSLYELSNRTVRDLQSTSATENFARIMYQLDVYAKTKAEAKAAYKAVDDEMIAMGFIRISGNLFDNPTSPDLFRYTARYEAYIDPEGIIHRVS